ncbi:PAS domain S-box-containing protein/diguanylate cyclase (GGDEF) domain-containing protein [Trujillonella endophytica]|uniref:PAS domain S-box-containing protein/diguanylate cyclase (GGDEF) domain-containing protein n=1 Tax=Trujillonella endophytica TaxID=673521 RepID=A0A1H8S9E8_9ACTN|nr:PAS domain S-box-containing protein/diguanylate cyclase (GGDEF) domain-containing protein [Trujillella endophytica]
MLLVLYVARHGSVLGSTISHGVELAAASLAWWGSRRQPAHRRTAAMLLALGLTLFLLADLSWWAQAQLDLGAEVAPSDALYLSSYAALASGLWRLAGSRERRTEDLLAGFIDAVVVFLAALTVVWHLSLASLASDAHLPTGTRIVWSLYPALDALLIGLALRLFVRRDASPLVVAAGAGIWLVCDIGYLLGANATVMSLSLDSGWMAGAVLIALATVSRPSERPIDPRRDREDSARGVLGRLAICLCALLVPTGMEAVNDMGGVEEEPGLLLVVSVLLVGLLFARTMLLVRAEAAARARLVSQQRYSAALAAHSSDAVVVLGRNGQLLSDPATLPAEYQRGRGIESADLVRELGADPGEALAMFLRAIEAAGEMVDAELECARQGEAYWYGVRLADLTDDPDVRGVVIHITDITARKRAEEALAHQAFHDALTGLANRALFADRVDQALRRGARSGGRPAVVFIDLDGFKGVNDTLGHAAGDALLRGVAARLRGVVRIEDTVARLGGDEFALLVEQSGADEAVATAQRVLDALAEPFPLDGQSVTVSGSVGIAVGDAASTSDSLVGDADIAMYAAKLSGRGRSVVFDPAMRASAVAARELEQELQGALARGELRLAYQPVVDLADDRVTGFEALLRWDSRRLGPVCPSRFVPVAEASGLIEAIGAWVLHEACTAAAAWRAEHGRDLTMAVNVSAVQLTSPHLIGHITDALAASGLPASALVLEVTETALVSDPERASECLAALRALGLRLALDDFGTGYSSLAHLRQFTVDVLKIDRSFVATIGDDGVMPPIVRGMIDLGRTLGLEIVAEGVETETQRRLLVEGSCDSAQGYLFARPLEPADASLLLLATSVRAGA